jgi:hypothetical protein
MVNIWLSFVPGSGASILEMLLRTCTDLQGLPVDQNFMQNDTAHGVSKQWHPRTKEMLFAHDYKSAQDNVFTPIVPMPDFKGIEILNYIDNQNDVKVYIGPSTDIVSEFALVCSQKVPNFLQNIVPNQHASNWSDKELEIWEKREYLSLHLMQWWTDQMQEQWIHAKKLGFYCIDTMNLFKDLQQVFYDISKYVGVTITDSKILHHYCKTWAESQNKIWQDWENVVNYKQGKPASLKGDIIQESIIQYHLRKQGIELKCYKLNTFPKSEELKKYYD